MDDSLFSNGGTMRGLSEKTIKLICKFFSDHDKAEVINIIKNKCGNNLPFLEDWTSVEMERIRFAVIKLSDGHLDKLQSVI